MIDKFDFEKSIFPALKTSLEQGFQQNRTFYLRFSKHRETGDRIEKFIHPHFSGWLEVDPHRREFSITVIGSDKKEVICPVNQGKKHIYVKDPSLKKTAEVYFNRVVKLAIMYKGTYHNDQVTLTGIYRRALKRTVLNYERLLPVFIDEKKCHEQCHKLLPHAIAVPPTLFPEFKRGAFTIQEQTSALYWGDMYNLACNIRELKFLPIALKYFSSINELLKQGYVCTDGKFENALVGLNEPILGPLEDPEKNFTSTIESPQSIDFELTRPLYSTFDPDTRPYIMFDPILNKYRLVTPLGSIWSMSISLCLYYLSSLNGVFEEKKTLLWEDLQILFYKRLTGHHQIPSLDTMCDYLERLKSSNSHLSVRRENILDLYTWMESLYQRIKNIETLIIDKGVQAFKHNRENQELLSSHVPPFERFMSMMQGIIGRNETEYRNSLKVLLKHKWNISSFYKETSTLISQVFAAFLEIFTPSKIMRSSIHKP